MKLDQFPRRSALGDASLAMEAPTYIRANPTVAAPSPTGDCGSCALAAQAMAQAQPLAVAGDAVPTTAQATTAAPAAGHDWLWFGAALLGLWYLSKPKRRED